MSSSGSAPSRPPAAPDEARVVEVVRRALREVQYGSVLITIHQGEVVAVETSTKVRLKG